MKTHDIKKPVDDSEIEIYDMRKWNKRDMRKMLRIKEESWCESIGTFILCVLFGIVIVVLLVALSK